MIRRKSRFHFAREMLLDALPEGVHFVSESFASCVSAGWREQKSGTQSQTNSRSKAKRIAGSVVLSTTHQVRGPVCEIVSPVPDAVSDGCGSIVSLIEKVNSGSKQHFE